MALNRLVFSGIDNAIGIAHNTLAKTLNKSLVLNMIRIKMISMV